MGVQVKDYSVQFNVVSKGLDSEGLGAQSAPVAARKTSWGAAESERCAACRFLPRAVAAGHAGPLRAHGHQGCAAAEAVVELVWNGKKLTGFGGCDVGTGDLLVSRSVIFERSLVQQ